MSPIILDVSLNEIIKTMILAGVNGASVFLSVRYLGRIVDRIEKGKNTKEREE